MIKDLQTWRHPGEPISEMSVKSLTPQQEKAHNYNLPNAPKFEAGERISLKSTSVVKAENVRRIRRSFNNIMGSIKTESATYQNIERPFVDSNSDPSGLLLKGHLGRYWNFVSPSTNRQTYYAMQRFFEFLKSRNEPLIGWEVWSVLVYFEQRRSELLENYDERVAKQIRLGKKREAKPVGKSHALTTSRRRFENLRG